MTPFLSPAQALLSSSCRLSSLQGPERAGQSCTCCTSFQKGGLLGHTGCFCHTLSQCCRQLSLSLTKLVQHGALPLPQTNQSPRSEQISGEVISKRHFLHPRWLSWRLLFSQSQNWISGHLEVGYIQWATFLPH